MSGDRNSNQQPSIPESARLGVEHAWLALALVALTTATVALFVEEYTSVQVLRGGYSILTGLFVCGGVGWLVKAAERRVRREQMQDRRQLADCLAAMRANQAVVLAALDQIRAHMASQQKANRPGIHTPNRWTQPAAQAAGGPVRAVAQPTADGDTVPLAPIPPETQAVLRRINMRLHQGGADGQ